MDQTKSLFEQYIDTIPAGQVRTNLLGTYKWMRAYAKRINVPISSMGPDDLVALLNNQNSVSPATIRGNILILRNFYRWMKEQKIRQDNPADIISYHDIDYALGCRMRYFKDYSAVLSVLNVVWTPDDGQATYPLTVFAWLGIPISDAPYIKKQDIDLRLGMINHPGQDCYHRMSAEMIDVLSRYDTFSGAKRDNRITMLRNYGSPNFLYRLDMENREQQPDANAVIDVSMEFTKFKRCLKRRNITKKFIYSDIVKSGALHRMYIMEKEGEAYTNIEQKALQVLKIPEGFPGDLQIIYHAYKKAFELK